MDKGEGTRIAGWSLFGGGLIAVVWAFQFKVSVPTGLPDTVGSMEVVNAALLQQQVMVMHCGLAAIIAGAILIATGLLLNGLAARD